MNYTNCIITSEDENLINDIKTKNGHEIISDICNYIIEVNDNRILKKYLKKHKLDFEAFAYFNTNIDKYFRRKRYLVALLSEYLLDNHKINIDGFIKFRLRDYNIQLINGFSKLKNDYSVYIEYLIFIEMIRKIISNQNRMIDTLNILVEKERYIISDENNYILNERCTKILKEEFGYDFSDTDEFLFSAIITLAPEKVCVENYNNIKNKNLFETIKKIYKENYFIKI